MKTTTLSDPKLQLYTHLSVNNDLFIIPFPKKIQIYLNLEYNYDNSLFISKLKNTKSILKSNQL